MKTFTGMGVALITPFDDQLGVDVVSLRKLIDYVIAGGADYLVALGTTSENPTLEEAEKHRVMEVILEQNNGRLPVMVGLGGNHTEALVRTLRDFPFTSECQGILSVTPYYNKPTQQGLYMHYKKLADHAALPLFLYNVPGRTGVNMTADTVVRLSQECPGIAGIKEASGNFQQISDILEGKRADFMVISGDDGITQPLMSMGVEGVISVIGNLCPVQFSSMVHLMQAGKYEQAAAIHAQLSSLYKSLFAEGNPAGVKAGLYIKNVIAHNTLRLPLVSVSDSLFGEMERLCQSI